MAAKGGRVKRAKGFKWLVQRHGRMSRQDADSLERGIEKRERRLGRREIDEQQKDMDR